MIRSAAVVENEVADDVTLTVELACEELVLCTSRCVSNARHVNVVIHAGLDISLACYVDSGGKCYHGLGVDDLGIAVTVSLNGTTDVAGTIDKFVFRKSNLCRSVGEACQVTRRHAVATIA